MKKSILRMGLALLMILSLSCTALRSTVETKPQAGTPVPFSFVMDLECNEMAASFPVDPAVARQLLPMEYEFDPEPDGKARGVLVAQDCSKLVLDGENLGRTAFAHQWIKIKGPHEMAPVLGAERTFPTFYWYVLEDQTTSDKLIAAGKRAGMNYTKVETLLLDSTQGRVVEKKSMGKQVGYAWTNVPNPIPRTAVGMNHRFYHNVKSDPNIKGKTVGKGHVKCLLHVVSRNGSATIQADPESAIGRFEASVLKGSSLDFQPMQCQATIGIVSP